VSFRSPRDILVPSDAWESRLIVPGYLTKQESIAVLGVHNLDIRSLRDRQQFSDPDGLAESLGISSGTWPIFGLLWPSGAHLAARLAKRAVLSSETILEVGCGLALASLVGHRRGANVTASDIHRSLSTGKPPSEPFATDEVSLWRVARNTPRIEACL
jgi:hypothetical protein